MRLTIALLGWTWDLSLEPTAAESETDPAASMDGGTTASIGPLYFTAPTATVEDCPLPQRTPAWDDEE